MNISGATKRDIFAFKFLRSHNFQKKLEKKEK